MKIYGISGGEYSQTYYKPTAKEAIAAAKKDDDPFALVTEYDIGPVLNKTVLCAVATGVSFARSTKIIWRGPEASNRR